MREGNLFERFLRGCAGRHKISQISVRPVQRQFNGNHPDEAETKEVAQTNGVESLPTWLGSLAKSRDGTWLLGASSRGHGAYASTKSTILNIASQNLCSFSMNGDNAEFNVRVDHGLHELVMDWLLDSTAPVS